MKLSEEELGKRFGLRFVEEFKKEYKIDKDYYYSIAKALYGTICGGDSIGFANWCDLTAIDIDEYQNLEELQKEIDHLQKEEDLYNEEE